MRRIKIDKLKTDMVLAKPIYTNNGVILIKDGTALTSNFIDKINGIDIDFVYIKDEISDGIEIETVISEETKNETKKNPK